MPPMSELRMWGSRTWGQDSQPLYPGEGQGDVSPEGRLETPTGSRLPSQATLTQDGSQGTNGRPTPSLAPSV